MLKRKIYGKLLEWKNVSNGSSANTADLKCDDGIAYLPLYMAPLL